MEKLGYGLREVLIYTADLAEEVQIELEENVQLLSYEPNPPRLECAWRMEKEAERPVWHCWCGEGERARE